MFWAIALHMSSVFLIASRRENAQPPILRLTRIHALDDSPRKELQLRDRTFTMIRFILSPLTSFVLNTSDLDPLEGSASFAGISAQFLTCHPVEHSVSYPFSASRQHPRDICSSILWIAIVFCLLSKVRNNGPAPGFP